jgi:hypothetical protein
MSSAKPAVTNAVDGMSGSSCQLVIRSVPALITVSTSTGWKISSTVATKPVHRSNTTVPSAKTATTSRIAVRNGHA